MKKLKERWNIKSNWQLTVILLVFAVTGSTAGKLGAPIAHAFGVYYEESKFLYIIIRIFAIFPLYQVLIVCFGWLFGEFEFFWSFEKKMLRRLGFKRFFPEEEKTTIKQEVSED